MKLLIRRQLLIFVVAVVAAPAACMITDWEEPEYFMSDEDDLGFLKTHVKCNSTHFVDCGENGDCYHKNGSSFLCHCAEGFSGRYCQDLSMFSTGFNRQTQLTLLISMFGLFFTMTVLIILLFIIWRVSKLKKEKRMKMNMVSSSLDKDISNINEELEKLPHEEKLFRLTRFSKLIEATTRAALVTFPGPSRNFVQTPSTNIRYQSIKTKTTLSSISEKPYGQSYRRFSAPTLFDPQQPESKKQSKLASVMGRTNRQGSKWGPVGDGGDDCQVFMSI